VPSQSGVEADVTSRVDGVDVFSVEVVIASWVDDSVQLVSNTTSKMLPRGAGVIAVPESVKCGPFYAN
jgi:hypothetical protein